MKLIKRELLLCIALTAFVFVCALAWGSPFLAIGSGFDAVHAQEPQTARAEGFNGTIEREGEQFLLRDASGQVYLLDDAQRVQPFEGKTVTITGTLDRSANAIHVERIDSATI